jgi:hypothetical protein
MQAACPVKVQNPPPVLSISKRQANIASRTHNGHGAEGGEKC